MPSFSLFFRQSARHYLIIKLARNGIDSLGTRLSVLWLILDSGLSMGYSLYSVSARGGNLGEFFGVLLLLRQILVRGACTLGKALVLRVGLCGLWQVCCLGRPHFLVTPKSHTASFSGYTVCFVNNIARFVSHIVRFVSYIVKSVNQITINRW